MRINIKKIIEYFDLKESSDYGDTTAIISVVGEDFGAALFKDYCKNQRKSKVEIINPNEEIPTEGTMPGRRLDRWILEESSKDKILYQTEIKSWCSRAIGGINVPFGISEKELMEKIKKNWGRAMPLMEDRNINGLNKVLVEMPTDKKLKRLGVEEPYIKKPLLIFWEVINPDGKNTCFSKYNTNNKNKHFKDCFIFSCSLYLRQLYSNGTKDLSLDIPNAERRIKSLNNLFKV